MIVADVPFATTSLPCEITVFYESTGGWDLMLVFKAAYRL
jgi:hypothetical protein